MNKYVLFFAVNWPDALLDRNGLEHWPLNYIFAGVFQADSLEGLWDLLNRDDRPNANVERSMCVGDIAVVAEADFGELSRADGKSGETPGQMWIARRLGWEKLRLAGRNFDLSVHWSGTAFLRRCALEGEPIEEIQIVAETL
jgi:hypothetical protein